MLRNRVRKEGPKMQRKLLVFALITVVAQTRLIAATKPKPKPAPKPPVSSTVLVTTQMKGENAQFGVEYTVGKTDPVNIILKSAEFTTSRIRIGDEIYYPKGSEKFLLLHYTLRNPQKSEKAVGWNTFRFTAVDETNTNREYSECVGVESNSQTLNMSLKPAQKIDVYTFVAVPAKGTVPKVVVKGSEDLVLRYYPKDKIKPLTGPTADQSDPKGTTALTIVPAKIGETYQTGRFDIRVDGAKFSTTPFEDQEMEEGCRNLIIDFSIKNGGVEPWALNWGIFEFTLTDADGLEIEWNQSLLQGNRDAELKTNLEPGQEVKARIYYMIQRETEAKLLKIMERDDGRVFAYDLSKIR
jgi:hypothetical protein